MLLFMVKRILLAIPTLLITSACVFLLIRLIPGDPAMVILGDLADPASVAELRTRLGMDRPLVVQFFIWLGNVLQGDFGRSIITGEPVAPLVLQRFFVSAQVVVVAVAAAALVAVPAGTIAAWRQNSALDFVTVSTATLLLSIPAFWMGLMLLLVFSLMLGWVPIVGYVTVFQDFSRGWLFLILPAATLFMHEVGSLIRMTRASTLEVLGQDYVTHARAKGLSEATVLTRHVFRNAFGPTMTLIGLVLGNLLGGIVVVETVFSIPGLGRLLLESIFGRDYPMVQGILILVSTTYVLVNLAVDLAYPFFDPRVAMG